MFRRRMRALSALIATLIVGACTETQYVERDPVNPPPDAASGFVGYFDASTRLTTCGNCHVTHQGKWETTAHASAWAALPVNAPAYCAGCHTVNEAGNSVDSAAGYNKVQSDAYHDVQCESCHGPGFAHASNPDGATPPLAHIGVTQDPTASCASCHSGDHTPFAEQWAASGHNDSAGMASPASNASCKSCHEGNAAIRKFNGNQNTRYADSAGTKTIVCVVCHDPHGSKNVAQLRAPIDSPDPTVNLCMQCHLRNATATASFTRGGRSAHSSQGPILMGEGAGWMPPGFFFDSAGAYATHGSSANPRLCAGCHVNSFSVTDSNGVFATSTGHTFNPIPCVDGAGKPLLDNSCAHTSTARNWSACTVCHADASVVANLFNTKRATVQALVRQLWYDVDGDKVLDAYPADSGYLAQVWATTPAEFDGTNALTTAEGALFNTMMLAEVTQYDHADGSYGVHNPFFYDALLSASISAVQATYGLAPPPPQVQAIMDRALSRPAVRYTPPAGAVRVATRR